MDADEAEMQKNLQKISIGMNESEVHAILGEPAIVVDYVAEAVRRRHVAVLSDEMLTIPMDGQELIYIYGTAWMLAVRLSAQGHVIEREYYQAT